ncbi:MAG TPA: hypothetical protein VMV83_03330 [Rectinemataceae bacterium]|nr:hypothetical protein [Rectinemataceae bacterium]
MKRITLGLLVALLAFATAAQNRGGTSLGIFAGGDAPGSATANIASDGQVHLNWGFFVNLPLLQTFNIAPSAEVYKFGTSNATDFDIAFKFVVPLSGLGIFAGISPGLTTVNTLTAPHVGVLGGATFGFVSNLDVFAMAKYTIVFDNSQNASVVHANAGIMFYF